MKLLRECIKLTLSERIRSKGFDLAEFKSLTDPAQMVDYASEHLRMLGSGTARKTFLLSSRRVLKIAYPFSRIRDADLAYALDQNRAEVEIYTDPAVKPIVARVYDADSNYYWLISELVRPIRSSEEFHSLTGLKFSQLHDLMLQALTEKDIDSAHPFVNSVLQLVARHGLDDIGYVGHWGKTADGRVVILDYGWDAGTNERH